MVALFHDIQIFLLNIFLFLFFFFIYFNFIEKKIHRLYNEFLIILVSGISIVLCMTFPMSSSDHTFDFRQVPWIIGALYGGRRATAYLFFILIFYGYYSGLPAFNGFLIGNILLFIALWYMAPFFNKTARIRKRIFLAVLASFFWLLIRLFMLFVFYAEILSENYILLATSFFLIQTTGIMIFISIVEKSRRDMALAKEIRKIEKLKTVSEIAASISHEVRNPLTVTKGFIQLMDSPDLKEVDKKFYIKHALESLEKAESTITDYLTFAKPSLDDIEILEVNKELDYTGTLIKPYATMNNVFLDVLGKDNLYIAGEKQKFHQCLINIIKNGIESMPNGGHIIVTSKELNGKAVITVQDTGVGMNEEQIERLGTPFHTTKDIGTGLGTMVVYSIVKAMGGEIKIESEPGNGTLFTIIFPVAEHYPLQK